MTSERTQIWLPRVLIVAALYTFTYGLVTLRPEWFAAGAGKVIILVACVSVMLSSLALMLAGIVQHAALLERERAQATDIPVVPRLPMSASRKRTGHRMRMIGGCLMGLGFLAIVTSGLFRIQGWAGAALAGLFFLGLAVSSIGQLLRPRSTSDEIKLPISMTLPEIGEPRRGPVRDANP